MHLYKMDDSNYGSSNWNPLGEVVHPGDHVLIKPNLVMDYNKNKECGTDCLFTHPSLVAPIIAYCLIALKGKGKIVVGDAPMQECDFNHLLQFSGYKEVIDYFSKFDVPIEFVDFRELTTQTGRFGLLVGKYCGISIFYGIINGEMVWKNKK